MKNIFITLYLLIFCQFYPIKKIVGQCKTDYFHEKWLADDTNNIKKFHALQAEIAEFSKNNKAERRATYIIPIVFHVIHNNGPENISREQILDQIRVLNEDFQRLNADTSKLRSVFKARAANFSIEFRLAKIDPIGNCTDGINRIQSTLTQDAGENVKTLAGTAWPFARYLNIYVVNTIEQDPRQQGILLGYARFPWQTNQSTDGILIRADRVGTIGTAVVSGAGRTLTHEIGHCLGLLHPFQGGCSTNNFSTDQVDDTPPVAEQFSNSNCPVSGNSCSIDVPNELDLWENYMDYSTGNCQNTFTIGQKARSDFFLTSSSSVRRTWVQQSNLISTGVANSNTKPTAFFFADRRVVCVNEIVKIYDGTCKGDVVSRNWDIQGVATQNLQDAGSINAVTWDKPGLYNVSLTVGNTNGNSTVAINQYIEVLPLIGSLKNSIVEKFSINTINSSSVVFSPIDNGSLKFENREGTGINDMRCAVANIKANTPLTTKFIIETQAIDARFLRGLPTYFNFFAGYERQNVNSSEELRIFISENCGSSWNQLYFRRSNVIGNGFNYSNNFVPSNSSDWKKHTIALNTGTLNNDSNFRMRIEVTSNGGNPVFIDDINVSQFASNIETLENSNTIIYPNPVKNTVNITTSAIINELMILNSLGAIVYKNNFDSEAKMLKDFKIDVSNFPNGIYFVKFTANNNTFAQKLVVNN